MPRIRRSVKIITESSIKKHESIIELTDSDDYAPSPKVRNYIKFIPEYIQVYLFFLKFSIFFYNDCFDVIPQKEILMVKNKLRFYKFIYTIREYTILSMSINTYILHKKTFCFLLIHLFLNTQLWQARQIGVSMFFNANINVQKFLVGSRAPFSD